VLIAAKPYEGELLRRAIESCGRQVRLTDISSAGDEAARERPDAVILAVRRGQEEEWARVVEALAGLEKAPPVLLVADAGEGTQARGVSAVVPRPVDPAALVEALDRALLRPRLREELELPTAKVVRSTRPTGPQLPAVQARMLTGPQLPVARPTGPLLAVETLRMLSDDLARINESEAAPGATPARSAAAERGAGRAKGAGAETEEVGDPASSAPSFAAFAARSGSLGAIDLPHLFEQAMRSELTGRCTIQRDDAVKTVIFDGGAPVFATSNQPYDRLGDLLYREGKLSWEQYVQCQDLMVESGRRIGAVLVDKGLIKPRELFPLVRHQVEEIIYSLFAWWDGHYVIGFGEPAPEERIRLEVHGTALCVEGIRRKYGLDRLLELVGPPETRLMALPALDQRLARAGLSADERAALEAMDGERTLREISRMIPIEEPELYQIAYAALVLGAVLPKGAGDVRSHGGEPVPVAQRRDLAIDRKRVAAKHAQVREGDYFSLLGLRPDATSHEVLRAYERMRLDFSGASIAEEVSTEMAVELAEIRELVEEAYQILGDDALREAYRESLELR